MKSQTIIVFDQQYITQVGITALMSTQIEGAYYFVQSKHELVKMLTTYPNACLILDFSLSDIATTDDLCNLMARFPNVKWLLFSDEFLISFFKRLQHFSCLISFLLKSSSLQEVTQCIQLLMDNESYLSPQLKNMIEVENEERKEKLTLTEEEILKEIANGLSAKQVAQKRNVSIHTIVTHKKNIYRKLQINTIQEAYMYAMRAGMLNINDYSI